LLRHAIAYTHTQSGGNARHYQPILHSHYLNLLLRLISCCLLLDRTAAALNTAPPPPAENVPPLRQRRVE
jgi:hypothetical protein